MLEQEFLLDDRALQFLKERMLATQVIKAE
jgi:hypothetical protein